MALGNVLSAGAQENLSAPAGWSKSTAPGEVVFTQSDSGCRFSIKKLTPLGSNLRRWFDNQVEKDSQTRGELVSRGEATAKDGNLSLARNFQTPDGPLTVIYTGYAVGQQGRFIAVSGPSALTVLKSLISLKELGQQLGDMDEATRRGGSSAGSVKNTPSKNAPIKSKTAVPQKAPIKLPAVNAVGTLKESQILGVYLDESYGIGIGGGMIIQYDPILLLKDGTARRDLEIPPLDVNLARDKAANSKDWGRWTRNGEKFQVKWGKGDSDDIKIKFKTRPAKPGETLARGYTSIGGGGNTALGGDVMTFYSNSYIFARDGRFGVKSSGGGSSSSVTALSNSQNGGRYRLDGHALTLKFNDGRQIRRLFYFYPNDNKSDVIGIGDSAFIGDK